MTLTYASPTALKFRDTIRVHGEPVGVFSIRLGEVTYRGITFPVVFVSGRRADGRQVKATLVQSQELIVAR